MTFLTIEVQRMSYAGSTGKPIIVNLKLQVDKGEIVTILGPSGSGKTTLLRIIAGLESRFLGHIRLEGAEITGPSRRIQLVFQDGRLLPWKTLIDNLRFARTATNGDMGNGSELEALDSMGIAERSMAWPSQLSGGENSRAALARALVSHPQVLLLDEPFRNLDSVTRTRVQSVLAQKIREEKIATIQVSHSVEDAVWLSDRVISFDSAPIGTSATTFPISIDRPRRPRDVRLTNYIDAIFAHISQEAQ